MTAPSEKGKAPESYRLTEGDLEARERHGGDPFLLRLVAEVRASWADNARLRSLIQDAATRLYEGFDKPKAEQARIAAEVRRMLYKEVQEGQS